MKRNASHVRTLFTALVTAVFLLVMGSGCDMLAPGTGDGTSQLSVLMKDAPFPFDLIDSTNVTITKVQLVPADESDGEENGDADTTDTTADGRIGKAAGISQDSTDNGDDDAEGIIELETTWEGSKTFNLLALRDSLASLVEQTEIPVGTYSQIRLIVDGKATLVDTTGKKYDLFIPSGQKTGVKVLLNNLKVTENGETTITLDFSVEESFILKGSTNAPTNFNEAIFKPTVKLENVTEGSPDEARDELPDQANS